MDKTTESESMKQAALAKLLLQQRMVQPKPPAVPPAPHVTLDQYAVMSPEQRRAVRVPLSSENVPQIQQAAKQARDQRVLDAVSAGGYRNGADVLHLLPPDLQARAAQIRAAMAAQRTPEYLAVR